MGYISEHTQPPLSLKHQFTASEWFLIRRSWPTWRSLDSGKRPPATNAECRLYAIMKPVKGAPAETREEELLLKVIRRLAKADDHDAMSGIPHGEWRDTAEDFYPREKARRGIHYPVRRLRDRVFFNKIKHR